MPSAPSICPHYREVRGRDVGVLHPVCETGREKVLSAVLIALTGSLTRWRSSLLAPLCGRVLQRRGLLTERETVAHFVAILRRAT